MKSMKRTLLLLVMSTGISTTTFGYGHNSAAEKDTLTSPLNLTTKGFIKHEFATSIGKMAVYEAGEGEPLLLIHGIGAGASAYNWFTIAPELTESYRVIVPDLVGWGESDRPDRYLLFEDYVTQIKDLAESIGAPVKIWTQSLSCGFVIAAINEGNFEVEKLVFETPSGGFDFGVDAFGEQATKYFAGIADSPQATQFYARLFHQKPAVEDWWRREGFLNGQNVPMEIIESNHYNTKQPNAAYSALPFLSGKLRYDIAPLLENVDVPAIMLWGESEFRINPETQKKIREVNNEIESYRVKNARSGFGVEQPEQTLKIVRPFLKA